MVSHISNQKERKESNRNWKSNYFWSENHQIEKFASSFFFISIVFWPLNIHCTEANWCARHCVHVLWCVRAYTLRWMVKRSHLKYIKFTLKWIPNDECFDLLYHLNAASIIYIPYEWIKRMSERERERVIVQHHHNKSNWKRELIHFISMDMRISINWFDFFLAFFLFDFLVNSNANNSDSQYIDLRHLSAHTIKMCIIVLKRRGILRLGK